MEKPPRSKATNIFKFFPRAASFAIPRPPYSPTARDHAAKPKTYHNKPFFSGPMNTTIPSEVRHKKKNEEFLTDEPTSPKVSCIGQIKNKKKNCKGDRCNIKRNSTMPPRPTMESKKSFTIRKIFKHKVRPSRKADVDEVESPVTESRAPPLGKMRRFTSGRETLASFDWRESMRVRDEEEEEEEEEEVIIPHSAPIMMGGRVAAEPKKEVNLWKRRTTLPPMPLQLS